VFTSTRRRPDGKRRQVRRRGFSVARVWRSGLAVLRRPGRRWLVLIAGRRGGWSRRWRGGALASVRDRGRGSWCRRRGGPCAATRAPGRTGRVGRRVYRQVQVANCSITTVGVGRLVRPNENAHCAGADDREATPGVGEVGSVDVVAAPGGDPGQSVAVGRRWGGDQRGGTTNDSVRAWRRRFEAEGVEGVGRIAPGRGRRAWLPEGTVAAVLHDTLHAAPEDGSIDPIASGTADRGRRLERLQGFRWQSGLIPGRLPLAAGSGICIGRGRRCCDPSLSR
jgi:hypothetical protein